MIEFLKFIPYDTYQGYYVLDEIHRDGIKAWVKMNFKDFYPWLKRHDASYYSKLRRKHLFFSEKSIVEDFFHGNSYGKQKSKEVMDLYIQQCDNYRPLFNPSEMIDLKYCPPVIRYLHKFALGEDRTYFEFGFGDATPTDFGLPQGFTPFYPREQLVDILNRLGFTDGSWHIPSRQFLLVPSKIRTFFVDSSMQDELVADYMRRHQD